MTDYKSLMESNPEIVKTQDNFGADFYHIPRDIRGRNKTKIFNILLRRGWKQQPNPEYLSFNDNQFYAHNHKTIGIIIEERR